MDIITGKIDILDLVTTHVFRGQPTPEDPNPLRIEIHPLDNTKNVVFDESSLRTMNQSITEEVKRRELDIKDEKTYEYIKEFVERMVSSLYKNGLVELVDAEETPHDPYKEAKDQVKFRR